MVYKPKWHKNKYHAIKTELDGIEFDSKHEADVYAELKMLEKGGAIKDLVLQPKFELQPGFEKDGKKYRPIVYIADFMFVEKGKTRVLDAKGYKTEVYRMKKKMCEYKYSDLTIEEV